MLGEQGAQRVGVEQGHVAVADDDGAGQVGGQRVEGAAHGVPGPVLLLLDGGAQLAAEPGAQPVEVRGHGLAPVPHHHDQVRRVDAGGGPDRVLHEGAAGDRVQHLGGGRAHPGALARGQDHGGHRAGRGAGIGRGVVGRGVVGHGAVGRGAG
nr:hypothetical protein GCM10020241_28920 [Streptoalloteichus tenebrarius]